jgi:hypothetical protein
MPIYRDTFIEGDFYAMQIEEETKATSEES